jgi:hypothetical protein
MPDSTATEIADTLRDAGEVVRGFAWLTTEHTVQVEVTPRFGHRRIQVHGIMPGLLEELADTHAGSEREINADGILTWVEVDLAGFNVTFFRR